MAKVLVVADVHENISNLLKALVQADPVDRTVFLGDWFDRFPAQPGNLEGAVQWLLENRKRSEYTFLLGNHDLNYLGIAQPWAKCSGYTWQKASIIPKELFSEFKISHEVDGWTLSHAGFTPETIKLNQGEALDYLRKGEYHSIFRAGECRGGQFRTVGGPLWLDWNDEFQPVAGLNQIVGHTRRTDPNQKVKRANKQIISDNWCIDTGLRHYAVIEDGKVAIEAINGAE